ncbi:cupin domain-containing protein [Pseudomonas putida]|uniref:cupin domain-containing protein n=1 Tax=Pseudomonas putida TaxID=303 RepID=UPI002AC53CE4|nr:cupin domain-containing protein [Pseudomonas putida]MDZ5111279.1 cupin domain-containing protein [Pseudomonas putida]
MFVNADFSQPATVVSDDYQWLPSPQPGVERVMLDRLGGEMARATSIVRYAPQSCFPPHLHPGGEEIFVLSGTFSEDGNHFPAGYYLRNPPGSSHQPSSHDGAIIFVKLWQMQANDNASVRIDTTDPASWACGDGRDICPLFESEHEQVSLQRLAPREPVFKTSHAGAEVLVVDGQIDTQDQRLGRGSWMRLPQGHNPVLTSGMDGATLFIKTGHLAQLPERN